MVQRIEEQDGHMFLHFGDPPENIGKIEFVNCVAHQQNQILFCKWRDNDIWVIPSGRVEPGETTEEAAHRELLEETGATLKKSRSPVLRTLLHVQSRILGDRLFGRNQNVRQPNRPERSQ